MRRTFPPAPLIPPIRARRISMDGTDPMRVFIDFVASMPSPSDTAQYELSNAFIREYNVLVIQNMSQDIADLYRDMPAKTLIKNIERNIAASQQFKHKTFSIDVKTLLQYGKEQQSHASYHSPEAQQPEIRFSINERNAFEVSGRAPKSGGVSTVSHSQNISMRHLSYIFIPHLKKGNGRKVYGIPSVEVVINQGKLVEKARVYTTSEGKAYSGAIASRAMPPEPKGGHDRHMSQAISDARENALTRDEAMTMSGHNANLADERMVRSRSRVPYPSDNAFVRELTPWLSQGDTEAALPLRTHLVPNNVIHDLRILEQLRVKSGDFMRSPPLLSSGRGVYTRGPTPRAPEESSYFSDVFITRTNDAAQSARFLFSIDYGQLVRDKSRYKWLLQNTNNPEIITNLSKISSIEIYRRRASRKKNYNALGSISYKHIGDEEEPPVLIGRLIDNNGVLSGGTIETNPLIAEQDSETGIEKQVIGTISEINLPLGKAGIRTFVGMDRNVNKLGGAHQYTVLVEMQDGTTKYLLDRQSKVEEAYNTISEYYEIARGRSPKKGRRHYNVHARKFSKSLSSAARTDDILRALNVFVTVLADVTAKTVRAKDYVPKIWKLISPADGTLTNIQLVVQLISDFLGTLSNITRVREKSTLGGGHSPSKHAANDDLAMVKIHNSFDHVYISDFSRNDGYFFIPPGYGNTTEGMPIIPKQVFNDYMLERHRDLFPNHDPVQLFDNVRADLRATQYSYLTPIAVKTNEKLVKFHGSHANGGTERYNIKKYNQVFADIISENLGFDASGLATDAAHTAGAPAAHQKLRDTLITIFGASGRGISVENFRKPEQGEVCDSSAGAENSLNIGDSHLDSETAAPGQATDEELSELSEALQDSLGDDPSNALFMLLKLLLSDNNASWFGKSILETDFNMKRYGPNIFKGRREYNSLPNYTKALLTMINDPGTPRVNYNVVNLKGQLATHMAWFYEKFMNIAEVQVLTGFTNHGLREPIFRKMTFDILESLPPGQHIFCRLRRYNHINSGISSDGKLHLSIYDDHFLLRGTGAARAPLAAFSAVPSLALEAVTTAESGFDSVHAFTSAGWKAVKDLESVSNVQRSRGTRSSGRPATAVRGSAIRGAATKKAWKIQGIEEKIVARTPPSPPPPPSPSPSKKTRKPRKQPSKPARKQRPQPKRATRSTRSGGMGRGKGSGGGGRGGRGGGGRGNY